MSPLRFRAGVCACLVTGWLCLPAAAGAAPNLIANPGFETAGSSQTMFSDSFPDLTAWQITAGGYALAGGTITSTGAGSSSDLAIVRNSQDYQDGTLSARVTRVVSAPQLTGGPMIRYRSTQNFYGCGLTKNNLVVLRRLAGVDSQLASTGFTSNAGVAYAVTATATGSTITCTAQAVGGGPLGSVSAVDANFASGSIGLFSINSNPARVRQSRFASPLMTATAPQSWSGIQVVAGRPGEIPDRIAPANSGAAYLQLFGAAVGFSGYAQQAGIAVTGGTSYTFSGAIRTEGVVGSAEVVAVENTGASTTLASVTGTTGWTLYSTTFTTAASAGSITIRLRLAGSGRASFDDLSLSAAPTVSLTLDAVTVGFGGVNPVSSPFPLASAVTATVVSNNVWTLSASGSGAFADGTGKTIPLGQLAWRVGAGAYTPFTTSAATVTSGVANSPSGTATPIDYRLQITYADPPSSQDFSTTLTYVATTP